MRKLLFWLGLGLIILALAGPYFIGRTIEKNVTGDNSPLLLSLPEWLEPVSHRYQRGWFTSRSELQLVITDPTKAGPLALLLNRGQFGDEPALILNSSVRHGPLVNALSPALASISTLAATTGPGDELLQLPVAGLSTIGLTGNFSLDWTLAEGGTLRLNNGPTLAWTDASGRYETAADGRAESGSIDIDQVNIGDITGAEQQFDDLSAAYAVTRNGQDIIAGTDFSIALADNPSGVTSVSGEASITGVPMASVPALTEFARNAALANPATLPSLIARYESVLRAALDDELPLEARVSAGTEHGNIGADFDVTLPEAGMLPSSGSADAFVSALLTASRVEGDITLPTAFVDAARAIQPELYEQLVLLRGMGILAPNEAGDQLVMHVLYADGSLTVNDAPLPTSALSAPQ